MATAPQCTVLHHMLGLEGHDIRNVFGLESWKDVHTRVICFSFPAFVRLGV